jgi:hypothetical protein
MSSGGCGDDSDVEWLFQTADKTPSPIVPEDTNILIFRNVAV